MTSQDENLRIMGIEVKNLFGNKNYNIEFNQNPNVTIIFGLNGTGKTTILRMITDILTLNFTDIELINFKSFTLNLKDHSTLEYIKGESPGESKLVKKTVKKSQPKMEWKPFSKEILEISGKGFSKRPFNSFNYLTLYNHIIEKNLDSKIRNLLIHERTDRIFDFMFELQEKDQEFNRVMEGLGPSQVYEFLKLFFEKDISFFPQWLQKIVESNPLLFIESERLIKYKEIQEERKYERIYEYGIPQTKLKHRVVNEYSEDLKRIKKRFIENFNEVSQSLDRTFPRRIIENINKLSKEDVPSSLELKNRIENIRKKENELISFGLLTKKQPEIADIDTDSLKISDIAITISLWVKDTQEKHSKFDELLDDINLFRNIINEHLSDKEIRFDGENGFYVQTNSGEHLLGDQLSSGEQHIVVLTYQLIFLAKPYSIVLIDEPEISLHTIWQNNFIDDIIKMGREKSLSFILATHSPQIIHGRITLTRELEIN